MTAAIPVHLALIDQSGDVPLEELQVLAGSLSEQITRDFAPIWQVNASVGAYTSPPANTWAVEIQAELDQPGALGYHTDQNNQPVAYVKYTSDYSTTISHEVLEMLADPYGNRMHGALIPYNTTPEQFGMTDVNQQVQYLLEVCDPCEAKSYSVGQNLLSDFLIPDWYFQSPQVGKFSSFAGGCLRPREVADGGYVSFGNPSGDWWQVFNQGGQLSVSSLGKFNSEGKTLREWVDQKAREFRLQ